MPYLCYKVVSTLITFLTATKMTYRVRHSRRAGEIEDIDQDGQVSVEEEENRGPGELPPPDEGDLAVERDEDFICEESCAARFQHPAIDATHTTRNKPT